MPCALLLNWNVIDAVPLDNDEEPCTEPDVKSAAVIPVTDHGTENPSESSPALSVNVIVKVLPIIA